MTERKLLQDLKEAKDVRDRAKDAFEKATHLYNVREQRLLEHLENIEATSTARYEDLGYAMTPKPRLYASCIMSNQEELFKFLKKEGRSDLIKTAVNPQSLSSFATERIENGEEMPDFINYYFKQSIRIY